MKKILVVDDNQDIRENTAEILALAGYTVLAADTGIRGAEMAIAEKPDLIVCDIMMPELDGYGMLHLVRKHEATQYTPFIFLTAKTERSDFRKGMEMGADDYLTKPFEGIELLNAVEIRLKKAAVLTKPYADNPQAADFFLKDVKDAGIISQLSNHYTTESYEKKQTLYQEGKRPRFLFCLVKGKVKTVRTHEDGKDYITNIYSEGDFIGYTALLEDVNYGETAVVLESSEILQVPKEDFLQMIYGDISVAARFIRLFTQNVKEKEERLLNLAYSSLRKRVARGLADLHHKYNTTGDRHAIEVSREEIANYVGTATESLIRTLSDFKAEKLVEIKEGKIRVLEPEKLRTLLY